MSLRPAFLLSQPRSGSTLLQRLLGAHSAIATVAEPWLLLPPLYVLREEGVYAEYSHRMTHRAVGGLLRQLPGGRADYLAAVASMARQVYTQVAPPGSRVFLDKTPRYGLVVDELLEAFPDAAFVVLHRNPLAVVASLSASFGGGRWRIHHHKQDLYQLPARLLAARRRCPDAFTVVNYETLVTEPRATLGRVLDALGLEWQPTVIERFTETQVAGPVGDTTGVAAYDTVSTAPLDAWRSQLASPLRKAWAWRYLAWIGDERLAEMGYDAAALRAELRAVPTSLRTLPLDVLDTLRGVLWATVEPDIARAKLRRLPRWHDIEGHT